MIKRILRSETAELTRSRNLLFINVFETIVQTNDAHQIQKLHEITEKTMRSMDEFKTLPFLYLFDQIKSTHILRQGFSLICLRGIFGICKRNCWAHCLGAWLVKKVIDSDVVPTLLDLLDLNELQTKSALIFGHMMFLGSKEQKKNPHQFQHHFANNSALKFD
jgi:hypothetical protein